ncbi:MAG: type 4 pilus major pilin, partial [Acidobacteriaceae bacterium]
MDSILGRVIAGILILLAIAGVVYMGAQALGSNKQTNAVSDLSQVQINVKGLYANNPAGYASLTNTVAINAQAVPADMVSGTSLVDQWGDAVTLAPVTAASGGGFSVADAGPVPVAACVKLATQVPGAKKV